MLRATGQPDHYEHNVVLVDDDLELSVPELIAVADDRLAGLQHRRLGFRPTWAAIEFLRLPDRPDTAGSA